MERFAGRFERRAFRLEDRSWLADLGRDVRCFVSSLVIHHLDGAGKQVLYRDLYAHLDRPGAVLIADPVAPRTEWERRYMARGSVLSLILLHVLLCMVFCFLDNLLHLIRTVRRALHLRPLLHLFRRPATFWRRAFVFHRFETLLHVGLL